MTAAPTEADIAAEARRAHKRLQGHIRSTPLLRAPWLDGPTCKAYLKLENLQITGSFKVRGALNALIDSGDAAPHVTAASTGNHGLGVAYACRALGTRATIFAPTTSLQTKIAAIKKLGADVTFSGADCIEAEEAARAAATETGVPFVSPYNDARVVAGQATVGVEVAEALDPVDTVFVAVGGGGLISGVGAVLRDVNPACRVVGCSPSASAAMAASVAAGRVVEITSEPTLSDGTAGGIEAGTITLPLCAAIVDHFNLVSERDIADAMAMLIEREHIVVEGAAGCALAGYLQERAQLHGNVVVIVCGGNVPPEVLCRILIDAESTRAGSET